MPAQREFTIAKHKSRREASKRGHKLGPWYNDGGGGSRAWCKDCGGKVEILGDWRTRSCSVSGCHGTMCTPRGMERIGDRSKVSEAILSRVARGEDATEVVSEMSAPRLIDTVRPHDRVTYLIPGGRNRDGSIDWVRHTGRVVMVKPSGHDHLVVNGGGRYGTPHVVDHNTLLKVHRQ